MPAAPTPPTPFFDAVRRARPRLQAAFGAACVLLLAGCAGAPPVPAQGAAMAQAQPGAAAPEQVCRREQPTGMRIPITVCRNAAEVQRRSENDRAWADTIPTEVPDVGR